MQMPPAPSRILVGGLSLAAVAALLYRSVGDPAMLVIVLAGIIGDRRGPCTSSAASSFR